MFLIYGLVTWYLCYDYVAFMVCYLSMCILLCASVLLAFSSMRIKRELTHKFYDVAMEVIL